MSGTIFPDLEKLLIGKLVQALGAHTDPIADNVFVSVKKPPAGYKPYPEKIVQIASNGAGQIERNITRSENIGVNVYAKTYEDANQLAAFVDAIIRTSTGGAIKRIDNVLSATRVPNPAEEEQRFMTYSVTLKSNDFN